MTTWAVIAAVGLGTYAMRVSMFLLVGGRDLPAPLRRSVAFVGPAAIAALVTTMVLVRDGSVAFRPAPTIAVLVGFLVVRRTGNVLHAFSAGLPTLWILIAIGL
jgi:branched chain amino acid efflux pump